MDNFLPYRDELAQKINSEAQNFYKTLIEFDLNKSKLSGWVLDYFKKSHFSRQFFSVQTAAELLYRSIKMTGKKPEELIVMDYGAGVGSLYLLAKKIGIKKVIYNDIIDEVLDAGKIIAEELEIDVDEFILGDHKQTLLQLDEKNIKCDIILSRNVIEHIYNLKDYYQAMITHQPDALHYSSTSANYHNPVTLYLHKKIHKHSEVKFLQERIDLIKEKYPHWDSSVVHEIATQLRGLAGVDIDKALIRYEKNAELPDPSIHKTNTCEPVHGIWAEHIIPKSTYKTWLEPLGYRVTVKPGFWDTHYSKSYKNLIGKMLNGIGRIIGDKLSLKTTAFIYVILEKK